MYLEPLLELAHDVPVLYLLVGLELAEGVVQLLQQGLQGLVVGEVGARQLKHGVHGENKETPTTVVFKYPFT